jgi:hypothetical protein
VTNTCGSVDSATATVSIIVCTAVHITQEPQGQQITSGQSANLSVGATGSTPFTFQWFRGNGGDTSTPVGGNTFTLNTGPLTTTVAFWVRITNCAGSVDSQAALITVVAACAPPVITSTTPAAPINIASGTGVTLGVQATGTSLAFQWFRGTSGNTANPVSGATASTLNTGNLTATSTFWVRVSNSCGTANSPTITVNVGAACDLTIGTQPANSDIRPGGKVTLSVAATGTGALTFQWFKGNSGDTSTPVGGATTNSLSVGPLTATTKFWVRVTSPCGTLNSATATVTLLPSSRHRPVSRP